MNNLEESKNAYDMIHIPENLNDVVTSAIAQAEKKRKQTKSTEVCSFSRTGEFPPKKRNRKIRLLTGWSLGTVAAAVVVITVGMNVSPVFAQEIQNMPVIGAIVKLFTAESYQFGDADSGISIEVPEIEFIREDTKGLADQVNREIKAKCDDYAKEAQLRAEEYKQAFLDTGGTQEEWEAHNIQIKVWYELKSQSSQYLSFVVNGAENWTSAYNQSYYYNLDLTNMKYVTLEDLLGVQYLSLANESIRAQIQERGKDPNNTFFTPDEGGFETITEDTPFYINEQGNPVIIFEKYTIAPGSMGTLEFEIER